MPSTERSGLTPLASTTIETAPSKDAPIKKSQWIKSTCAYCGVGCGVEAKVLSSGKVEIRGDQQHPANYGRLCAKGLALGDTVTLSIAGSGRLLSPSVDGKDCSWDDALSHVASSLTDIINEHGPDAVAIYVSGQLLTEDYYVANKLMKGFIGSANIDSNSRLCMASAVAGHKRAFGEDCVPAIYHDLELADVVVLVGSNLAWCHPVLYQRLKAAKAERGTTVVVVDPRKTSSCEIADVHLALAPGSDIALFNGLLAYLAEHHQLDNAYIAAHTSGFDQALKRAQCFSNVAAVAQETQLSPADISRFYDLFGAHPKTVTLFSQGVNQSRCGTDNVNSIINCHLATGRIGKPGSSPFSITGQPNAMGGREVGGLANTLAAHLEFGNAEHAALLSELWQTDNLASAPGLKAVDMFDAIERGTIKALWVMATNPAVSLPDSNRIKGILQHCPLVIVSDCIALTDTTAQANVCLPAQGWGERSGTVTNSERTISRQRRLVPTPGEGKPDWWIVCEVAKRMGFTHAFDYQSEADIFSEHVKLTMVGNVAGGRGQRLLNLAGLNAMTRADYHGFSPLQWPLMAGNVSVLAKNAVSDSRLTSNRLFSDGHFSTPDAKARFIAVDHQGPPSLSTPEFALILNSGRNRDQWHTMTRTGLCAGLSVHAPEPMLDIHPRDAIDNQIINRQLVSLRSEIGEQIFMANITENVREGHCFAPIHWSETHCSSAKVAVVIPAIADPISGQPEYKATPVAVAPVIMDGTLTLVTKIALDNRQLAVINAAFWVKQTCNDGYLYRFQFASRLEPVYVALMQMFENLGSSLIYCQNHSQSQSHSHSDSHSYSHDMIGRRVVIFRQSRPWIAFSLQPLNNPFSQPDIAQPDMAQLLAAEVSEQDIHAFLAGSLTAKSPIICACKQVSLATIEQAISHDQATSISQLSSTTQAGTGCGSCTAELEQIITRVGMHASLI